MPDYHALIKQAKHEFIPLWDLKKQTDEQLVILYVQVSLWPCLGVSKILEAGNAAPYVRETRSLISTITREPTANHLSYLYSFYPDMYPEMRPLKALVWSNMMRKLITHELYGRHKKHEAGMALLAEDEEVWRAESLNDYYEIFQVENLRTYQPHKETDDDLKQVAAEGACKFFKNRHNEIKAADLSSWQLPPLPEKWGFPTGDATIWNAHVEITAKLFIEGIRRDYLSLFRDDRDRVRGAAWDAVRQNDEYWKAQMRDRKVDLVEFSELRNKGIQPMRQAEAEYDAGQALKIATEFRGEKGRQFLQGLMDTGGNHKAACEAAGISRPNGYKIIKEIHPVLGRFPQKK